MRRQSLPVVRLYEFHNEVHYVVRQTDGSPLAVPGWMTDHAAAYVNMVSTARLPLCVLRELRRMAVTHRSASVHNVHEEL